VTEKYERAREGLEDVPREWLVTGAAGFIGSNLVESLLRLGQSVTGLDNFATGRPANLEDVRVAVGSAAWERFRFVEGDIRDLETCRDGVDGVEVVLHQAALGSVPRSILDPLSSHGANVDGFVNMLVAARDAGVRRFVYAGSSSTYGDEPNLPKVEDRIGQPLSPYAATKLVNEVYAGVFQRVYGLSCVGLRYFNVFGPRQDPQGPYAAVIPRWIDSLLSGAPCVINGDGQTSRDFCYVENVVQANLLAATAESAGSGVFNIAAGGRMTLLELHDVLRDWLLRNRGVESPAPVFAPFRPGDVRHSLADIGRARRELGYEPTYDARAGLERTMEWYVARAEPPRLSAEV